MSTFKVLYLVNFFGGFLSSSIVDTSLGEFNEWAIVGAAGAQFLYVTVCHCITLLWSHISSCITYYVRALYSEVLPDLILYVPNSAAHGNRGWDVPLRRHDVFVQCLLHHLIAVLVHYSEWRLLHRSGIAHHWWCTGWSLGCCGFSGSVSVL